MTTGERKFTLDKSERLRTNRDFERVISQGATAGDGSILVFVLRNALPLSRIGPAVSKKWGCAVRRNRLKRVIREAFRLSKHDLPKGLDIVVMPRTGWRTMKLDAAMAGMKRLVPKAAERLEEPLE